MAFKNSSSVLSKNNFVRKAFHFVSKKTGKKSGK